MSNFTDASIIGCANKHDKNLFVFVTDASIIGCANKHDKNLSVCLHR